MGKSVLSSGRNSLPTYLKKAKPEHQGDKHFDVFRLLGPDRTGKIPFLMTVIGVHGLIHLMGFVHAYHIFEVESFRQTITKPVGFLWMFTSLIFFAVVYLIATNKGRWWIPAFIAILISQILIFLSWQDAKFGTLLNLMILAPIIIEMATLNFSKNTNKEIELVRFRPFKNENTIVSEQMIGSLPLIVQKWLNNIGMVGNKSIQHVYLKQRGLIKLKPEQKNWYNAVAQQYVSLDRPAFLWKVNMPIRPYLSVFGRDLFINGKAEIKVKLAALVTAAKKENNDKINESSLQRFLLEMPWYPSLAAHPNVTWKIKDELSATATLSYQGITGSATFYFDKSGDLLKCSALRYKDCEKDAQRLECIGEVKATAVINEIKIPTEIDISWMLGEEKFTWYKLKIEEVVFS
ncbi:DUF6920 family protein [Bacillus sp. Marseille-P3661]|uniref:DUF6920 family protein n=1 Tax=Bacillus sp. Marseille-P3661 TaxID=1936234 RepID=UPI000C815B06|nr:DUF6544 family protein [Bacillus sp. Marseille-P3661]